MLLASARTHPQASEQGLVKKLLLFAKTLSVSRNFRLIFLVRDVFFSTAFWIGFHRLRERDVDFPDALEYGLNPSK